MALSVPLALLTVLPHSALADPATPTALPPAATALPTGGQVVAGQAQIQSSGPASLTVQQSSQRAAIDWQSFNIGSAASVQFQQPSAQSVALNRVLGADASQIFGKLSANGQVFLSNPQGIYFAPGAQVDVGGLVATTHRIGLDDFMAGRDTFTREGTRAGVLNLGRLTAAPGGYIALLAPEVRNEGVLVANAGTVALAAGEAITLNFGAAGNLGSITVTPAQIKTLVENRQAIMTEGGQVILASRAGDALLGSVVHTGTISASSISTRGGKVVIEGDSIQLAAGSRIEATGATGGGQVLVGGQAKGAGDMYQASTVTMADGASIDASATQRGDGGTVVLWSNIHDANAKTTAQGSIAARGAGGGNGGFVETSGANLHIDGIRVDTSAAAGTAGQTGEWLLDPYDLTVDASAAATISTNLATSNVSLLTTASSSSGPGTVNTSGSGDITVNSAISWGSANRLTLTAYRNVNIHAPITASGAGKVTITTGAGGDYSFGLTANGFRGSLRYTGAAGSGQDLTINGSAYTLLYTQANLATLNNAAGNYALARPLDLSSAGTLSAPVIGTLAASANLTGLGNTVNGMVLNSASTYVGLIGLTSTSSTVRDIGVTNSTLTTTSAAARGGLLLGTNNSGVVKNVYATGTATATNLGSGSAIGLLVGENWQGGGVDALIENAFAIGNVTVSGTQTMAGGLVGSSRPNSNTANSVIRNVFAIADVSANLTASGPGLTRIGGLVGESVQANATTAVPTISNAFSMGTVRSTGDAAAYVGGLAGAVGSNSQTSNVMSTSLVLASGSNVGGLAGFKSASGTITNGYYDGGTSGQSDTGRGTAQTTAQLQSGALPGGFSSANWTTGATGLYPYLTSFYPNGLSAISGTAYLNAGTTVSDATIGFYTGGSAITTLGTIHSGANGYYYAVTPTGMLPPTATSQIGATLTLAGASAVSGLTYTGLPVVAGGNVTGQDLRENVFLATTGKTTNTALQTDINATLGTSTYTALRTLLASALWQINASGSFSVDSALGHTGHTGLTAAGNLSLDAAVTATGSTLMLTAGGTVTDGASGSITASNLALLGGAVTLDGASNNVTTLAGSGLASLLYQNNGNVTVGTVGPLNTGVAAASIVGASSTIAGITATTAGGDVTVKSTGGITVAGVPIRANGGDITLWSNSAGAATGGIYVQNNSLLDSRTAADRTASNTSTASGGGAITLGGGSANTTLASGTVVPTGYAQNISGGAAGVQIGTFVGNNGTNAGIALYSGGGHVAIAGQTSTSVQASVANGIGVTGGVTIDAGSSGNITMTGASSAAPVYAAGINLGTFQAYGSSAGPVTLRTANGNIALNGTSTNATTGQSGVTLGGVSSALVTLAATGTGAVSLTGNATGTGAGDIYMTGADVLAASGAITLTGTGSTGVTSAWGGGSSANYAINLGAKAGSLVTGSTSNITISDDKLTLNNGNGLAFNTAGTVVVQPYGNNFSAPVSTANMSFASTVSSLTLGRDIGAAAHTDTVNVNGAVGIAGPISVYAGTIATSAGLASNNAGADILLKSTGQTTVGGNITTNAGDITVWSNATNAATGGIYVLDNTRFDTRTAADRTAGNTSTASGGGTITLGGGSASSTLASGTVVPTGFAQNLSGRVMGISLGTDTGAGHNAAVSFYSGGGDIAARGKVTGSSSTTFAAGLAAYDGLTMDGGTSGSIALVGDANYTLGGQSSATGDITRAAISVSTSNISKVYDGTTSANGNATLVGGQLFGNDTLSGGSFAYDNKNAGNGNKTVHVAGVGVLDGNASGNYDVSYVDNTSSTITARSLDLSGLTGGNKVYDGTTGAILIGTPTLGNLVAGDLVQIGGQGSAFFADKNAGIGKTITVGGFMLTGADAANYQIDLPTLTADITPRQLQVSGGQAQNKPYDGTTGATVSGITLVPGGVLAGDQVGLLDEDKGQFGSSGIGTNKPVSTAIGLSGADAGNYVLTQPGGLVASITSATNIGNVPGGPGSGPTDVIVLPNPLPTLPVPTPTPGGSGGLGGLPPVVVAPSDAGFVLAASNTGATGGEQARADGTQLVVHSLTILSTPAVAQAAGNDFVSVLSFEPFVARTGQLLAIALPRGTFEHSNPDETLTYEARRSDGSALPDWLRFDGSTRSFSGTAPAGVQPLDITITARDRAGHTARTSIRLAFSS